jgi:hypothetical protein
MQRGDAPPGRRKHDRREVHLPVRLERSSGQEILGRVENIGAGGAFFTTDDLETRLAEGEVVTLVFHRAGQGRIQASGEVLRIDTYFGAVEIVRSVAIRFSEELPRDRFPAMDLPASAPPEPDAS